MNLPTRRSFGRTLALLAALALALAACGPAQVVTSTDVVTKTVDAGLVHPGMLIRIDVFNGDITVTPSTDGSVSATITRKGVGTSQDDARQALEKIQVTSGITTSEAFVKAVWAPDPGSPGNHGASAVVAIPPGSAAILRTSNGQVAVTGVAGPLNIHTSNGGVRVEGATQGVSVDTSNARVEVDGVGGLMSLSTSNGAITVTDAVAARLSVKASNGAVSFAGSLGAGTSLIETSNAAVAISLPADASFAYALETSNASVTLTGFPNAPAGGRPAISGEIGSAPATQLDVHTSNQGITITALP